MFGSFCHLDRFISVTEVIITVLSNPRLKIFNISLGHSNFQKNWGQVLNQITTLHLPN